MFVSIYWVLQKHIDFDESMGDKQWGQSKLEREAISFVVPQIHLREIHILRFVCFGVPPKKVRIVLLLLIKFTLQSRNQYLSFTHRSVIYIFALLCIANINIKIYTKTG